MAEELILRKKKGNPLTQDELDGNFEYLENTDIDLQEQIDGKEPEFSKNTAFNKNFGQESDTVCEGDDSRLSDDRTPLEHGDDKHTETYVKDDDSRLSDSRDPNQHGNEAHSETYVKPDELFSKDYNDLNNIPSEFTPEDHNHDASEITSGVIDRNRLPDSYLKSSITKVDDENARFALSNNDVELHDVVIQENTGHMYFVIDIENLNNESGYEIFQAKKADKADEVDWDNVQDKPATSTRWPTWDEVTSRPSEFTPEDHTHTWVQVEGKPELYDKSEIDSKLDDKLNIGDMDDLYLKKDENLQDLASREETLKYLINADAADVDQVMSINDDGDVVWRTIDKYTQSEVDGFIDTRMGKNSNLNDVSDRQNALNNLTNSSNASEDEVLSVDSNGNSIWREIDKYTQSEVDAKLDEKADTSYVQDTYITKNSNLNDVSDRQNAIDNLTNSTSASTDDVLSVDSNGHVLWRELDKYKKHQIDNFLDEKSDAGHTHVEGDIENLDKYTQSQVDSRLSNKADVAHDHLESDITDLDKYSKEQVDNKLDQKANISYVQDNYTSKDANLSDVTNRQNALDNLTNASLAKLDYVLSVDSNGNSVWRENDKYTKSEVDSKLDEKTDIGHEHTESDITNLDKYTQLEVDSKLDEKSDTGHTHDEGDIENLDKYTQDQVDSRLSNKSDVGHGHIESDITDLDKYSKVQVDNKLDSKADVSHEHEWVDIIDKPELYTKTQVDNRLDTKADVGHDHDDKYPQLGTNGVILDQFLPADTSATHIVSDIDERNAIDEKFNGLVAYVIDASDDETVDSGGAGYIYHDGNWVKIFAEELFELELTWDDIDNKPELYTKSEVDSKLDEKSDDDHEHSWGEINDKPEKFTPEEHNHDDRYPVLNENDVIPAHYVPSEFKQSIVVTDIESRDNLEEKYEGLRVHVLDATADETVPSGGAGYIYHEGEWIKTYEELSLEAQVKWNDIQNRPALYTQSEINNFLDEKTDLGHEHKESDIIDLNRYTQEQVDYKLDQKADEEHYHTEADISDLNKYTREQVDHKLRQLKVEEDIQSNLDMGGVSKGDIIEDGTSLTEFVKELLNKTYTPSLIAPSLSANISGLDKDQNVEVGEKHNFELSAIFDRGSIKGKLLANGLWDSEAEQNKRAGEVEKYSFNGYDNNKNNVYSLTDYQIVEGENVFNISVNYNTGPQPTDSNGDAYESALSAGLLETDIVVYGKRKAFFGYSIGELNSTNIRNLSENMIDPKNGSTFQITIPEGATNVVFAYPAYLNDCNVRFVNAFNFEISDVFEKTEVQVNGANGYDSITYKVFKYTPPEAFTSKSIYKVNILDEDSIFYGFSADKMDSDSIKKLQYIYSNNEDKQTYTLPIPTGSSNVVFAYPKNSIDLKSIQYIEAMNTELFDLFNKTEVNVDFGNGNSVSYTVYKFVPEGQFETTATYNFIIN